MITVTNRQKTRVLNEILYTWCEDSHILYGDNRTPVEQKTFEEDLLINGMYFKGLDVEKIYMDTRNLKILITIDI